MISAASETINPGLSTFFFNETRSIFPSFLIRTLKTINWMIVNRGGFALLTGCLLVPSQFLCPNAQKSDEIITSAAKSVPSSIEKIDLSVSGGGSLKGVIYYPKNWNRQNRSRCVVYHNPNGMTVSDFFETGTLERVPRKIIELAQCPIIMYDYRGTGLSSGNQTSRIFRFRPTHASIVEDGEAALSYALEKFQAITMMGSSLGGGVATASLAHYIKVCPTSFQSARGRVKLINHDSFTTTTSVVAPQWPKIASWIGWAIGGFVDAATPMKTLAERGIPITVLCHQNDPIIPKGARMAEFITTLPISRNVSVIYSPRYGHANLSQDMLDTLATRKVLA
jgi:hypothetical protein